MHTTSAVSAADLSDMSDSALFVEMMTADDVVGEDVSCTRRRSDREVGR